MGQSEHNHRIFLVSIQDRLIQLRHTKELTQQEMADLISVHVNQIRRYEAGATQPSLEVLKKIALNLNITIDSLVFGEDERGPDDELRLQFEALSHFDENDKLVAQEVLESLILKHNAKRAFANKLGK